MASIRGAYGGAQIKGSIGSTTFQQGSSGTIIRSRTVPVNPSTPLQQSIRASMAACSERWSNTLTAAQRQGWTDYAAATPLVNRFGESFTTGGRQMFLRTNVAFYDLNGTFVDTAPATPGVATPVVPTVTGDTTNGIEIASVLPAVAAGAYVLVRIGIPVSQARNFYKAPFSTVTVLISTSTFPVALVAPAGVAIGQRWFIACRHYQLDGKVSEEVRVLVDITA